MGQSRTTRGTGLNRHLPSHLRHYLEERGIDLAALAEISDATNAPTGGYDTTDRQWRIDNAEAILTRSVPAEFRAAEINDFPDDAQHHVRRWLEAHLADPRSHPSILLGGLTGRGKTRCAWAILKTIVRAHAANGHGCVFRAVNNAKLNDELRIKPDQSHAYALQKYLDADLLLVEDLGSGRPGDIPTEAVLRIINHRYEHQLATIYDTNLDATGLADVFDERVASRCLAPTRVIIKGRDWRVGQGRLP